MSTGISTASAVPHLSAARPSATAAAPFRITTASIAKKLLRPTAPCVMHWWSRQQICRCAIIVDAQAYLLLQRGHCQQLWCVLRAAHEGMLDHCART